MKRIFGNPINRAHNRIVSEQPIFAFVVNERVFRNLKATKALTHNFAILKNKRSEAAIAIKLLHKVAPRRV